MDWWNDVCAWMFVIYLILGGTVAVDTIIKAAANILTPLDSIFLMWFAMFLIATALLASCLQRLLSSTL